MKPDLPYELEMARIVAGPLASTQDMGWNGAFKIRGPIGLDLALIISDQNGWEHVSVQEIPPNKHTQQKTPSWETMCWVKDLIWDKNEWVAQFHPAEDEYVDAHPYVLHLWAPTDTTFPTPPSWMVGPRKKKNRHGR